RREGAVRGVRGRSHGEKRKRDGNVSGCNAVRRRVQIIVILSDVLKAFRSGRRGASCLIVLVALFPLAQVSFQDPFLNKGQKRLTSNLRQADLIFVGTVIHVGPPPKFKSG